MLFINFVPVKNPNVAVPRYTLLQTFLRLAPFGMDFVFAPAAGTPAAKGRAAAEHLYLRMLHTLQRTGLSQEAQVARWGVPAGSATDMT
jgi:hypothetical protein